MGLGATVCGDRAFGRRRCSWPPEQSIATAFLFALSVVDLFRYRRPTVLRCRQTIHTILFLNQNTEASIRGEVILRRLSAIAVLLLLATVSTPLFGQSTYATVSGTVEDGTRALIPGVSVTATN